jgi:uncharacterized protein YjiS (DUF1127 family)
MSLRTTLGPVPAATRMPRRGGARRAMPEVSLHWVWALVRHWRERMRSRRQLRDLWELDDHLLRDIGLTKAALRCEANKPFWQ